nr:MAG TPA: hypothetical protein [Caudoviricetes sp.]
MKHGLFVIRQVIIYPISSMAKNKANICKPKQSFYL